MLILVDLDEILGEFIKPFLDFHNKIHGTNYSIGQAKDYHVNKMWGGTFEEVIEELKKFYDSKEFENISTIPGAKEGIDTLSKNNQLVIITARPNFLKEKTELWIKNISPRNFQQFI